MAICPLNLSEKIQERYAFVKMLQPKDPGMHVQLHDTLYQMNRQQDAESTIAILHRLQRFEIAAKLGVLDHPHIVQVFNDKRFILWHDFASLPIAPERQKRMADIMFDTVKDLDKPNLLLCSDYTKDISEQILTRCVAAGQEVDVVISDKLFERRLLNIVDEHGATEHAKYYADRYQGFVCRMPLLANHPSIPYFDPEPPENIASLESSTFFIERAKPGSSWLTQQMLLTMLPTPRDAEIDGLTYDEYVDLFVKMWEVDIDKIDACNKFLVAKLNAASMLRITNNDGTDVTFNIEGMTFVNSLMDMNFPGTEVFSAPKIDGTNGKIVAKGKFAPYMDDRIVEDIELDFKDGVIKNYNARVGFEYLDQMINTDEGSHRLGEVAFGTNPALQRHVSNTLLVEKICRSFHVAIGKALRSDKANVDNGNRSGVHWDITTMLGNKDGFIYLDDKPLMENGIYIDKELSYLNGPT